MGDVDLRVIFDDQDDDSHVSGLKESCKIQAPASEKGSVWDSTHLSGELSRYCSPLLFRSGMLPSFDSFSF